MALVAAVVSYAAVLRLDAITEIYGPVTRPAIVRSLQQALDVPGRLRPTSFRWNPSPAFPHRDGPPTRYRSDPYTYLEYARSMRHFFAAHRREPLFPFATKVSLRIFADQDVAVSFASAAFGVLAVFGTFLLGRAAFSYAVGLGAAVLLAIEYEVVTWNVGGWRDDAFTCAVVFIALALIAFRRRPDMRSAAIAGLAAGAGCLVRITALSFIVPGLLAVALWHARSRTAWKGTAVACAVMLVLVGPFLVDCWLVFGDPLYSINVHASVYEAAEGAGGVAAPTARGYLLGHLRHEPIRTIQTVALGLTTYPFTNKWHGFEGWWRGSGAYLEWLALGGLCLFAASTDGLLLLLVLVTSLAPFAATWRLSADWRFTEHAYPFFLLAACLPPVAAAQGVQRLWKGGVPWRLGRRWLVGAAAALVCGGIGWTVIVRVLPVLAAREALRSDGAVTIVAGRGDSPFFGSEWRIDDGGGFATRVASGARAWIAVPLPERAIYEATLRVDPSTAPVRAGESLDPIQVTFNGRLLAPCQPNSQPDRIGTCRLELPAGAWRRRGNALMLGSTAPHPRGFRVAYVHLQRRSAATNR
ncbi:MAG TPA: glycosyltransferase family 39 protein [Vicinamibacterales bacterium]|nr:glycosyltransferase family 39 protein [Vicinamibacterales bacterium]